MSRLNPRVVNPTTRWFEWDATNGNVRYYDKQQQENVPVSMPFTFLLLDELAKITGWSEKREASIYSNEVHSTMKEYLHVQCGQTTIAEGKYGGIKDRIEQEGGRYTASLYIAYKNDGDLVIGNLALKGGALPSWIDFGEESGQLKYEEAIQIKGAKEESFEKDGEQIAYKVPVFSLKEVSNDTHEEALDLNRELEKYFDSKPDYSNGTNGQEQSSPEPAEQPASSSVDLNDNFDDIDDDLPFVWIIILITVGSQILGSGLI